jgi:hypothetical protein
MPPPQLPRVEELEYWAMGGEKARVKQSVQGTQDTVTISHELYDRVPVSFIAGLTPIVVANSEERGAGRGGT